MDICAVTGPLQPTLSIHPCFSCPPAPYSVFGSIFGSVFGSLLGSICVPNCAPGVQDPNLRHTLQFGIGMHHAGLTDGDRTTCERLFVAGKIQILVATSTLAWGVNTPAHLVVIKGTEYFDAPSRSARLYAVHYSTCTLLNTCRSAVLLMDTHPTCKSCFQLRHVGRMQTCLVTTNTHVHPHAATCCT